MRVKIFHNMQQLIPYRQRWQQLAGESVFQSWHWITTWWKHYGYAQTDNELAVICVFNNQATSTCQSIATCVEEDDQQHLVAILPGYFKKSLSGGKTLRLLGDGEICSEHLDLLAQQDFSTAAIHAIAEHLSKHADDWDLINLVALEGKNGNLNQLVDQLQMRGCRVSRQTGQSCWAIDLPDTWEEFLAQQSKSHRKQLRRLDKRILQAEHANWHLVQTPEQFQQAWPILVDLHQRRRISLGEPGCFASDRWAAFHHEVAQQLLADKQLRLSWLELNGQPVAAEYFFANNQTTFVYQGGLDPDQLDQEPGRLSMIRTIQHAIQEGHARFDLLRGDEPYKAHWRAKPQSTTDVQIVPPRHTARLRFQVNHYLHQAGRFARQVTSLLS